MQVPNEHSPCRLRTRPLSGLGAPGFEFHFDERLSRPTRVVLAALQIGMCSYSNVTVGKIVRPFRSTSKR